MRGRRVRSERTLSFFQSFASLGGIFARNSCNTSLATLRKIVCHAPIVYCPPNDTVRRASTDPTNLPLGLSFNSQCRLITVLPYPGHSQRLNALPGSYSRIL